MITNDAYWEWVNDLPSELKSEQEYREMQAQELCEDMKEANLCGICRLYNQCEDKSKSIQEDL